MILVPKTKQGSCVETYSHSYTQGSTIRVVRLLGTNKYAVGQPDLYANLPD
jgi:hypothetical protein